MKFKRALENPFRVRTSPVPVTGEFEYKVYPEAQGQPVDTARGVRHSRIRPE
ncbi:MAG: hypothetical protein M0C28_17005 [Candidatus Moduliflexus flocculans]|nr:hypothetical protein [Candidatus Moduliflexus flocculans]